MAATMRPLAIGGPRALTGRRGAGLARVLAERGLAVAPRGGAQRALVAPPLWPRARPSCGSPAASAAVRTAAAAAGPVRPTTSALGASAKRLRDAILSHEAITEVAAEADAPVDAEAALACLRHELREGEEELGVLLLGEALDADAGRRRATATTPTGPGGGPAVRKVTMTLPSAEDVSRLISKRRVEKLRVEKPEELADMLEKFLKEKYLGKSSDHVGLLAAWGPKALPDAEGEFAEVAALMALSLRAYRAALKQAKEDWQFEINRVGDGKECLVMPPSNFALLGLKDAFHMLLQGFRVLLVVQPRFLPHFLEVQKDLVECGLPVGLVEVLPGITPEADPAVLHEALRLVDRLQFTGSSAMFKSLVAKAYELGNLRLEHGGEVSGLNKVRLDGVSVTHPAAAAGAAWSAMANNGELCTSASLLEFDPKTGDTAQAAKAALEGHSFRLGRDPTDASLNVLLKDGKTSALEVKTEAGKDGLREWWEKTVLAVPQGESPNVRTNQSLGHCIFAPSIERALALGVQEDASCVYCVGVPEDKAAPAARAGTTGCKIPESVFGGMKSHTYAVAGDHDGVGSVQTILNTVKRRGANWRDQEEAFAEYELTETAEMLLEFLNPRDQTSFAKQLANVLEVFKAFEPEVSKPYGGQPLVGAEGKSQLVTLAALRPVRKSLLVPRGVGLPEDVVKVAALCEMSPLRELPVDLHLLGAQQAGKLRVTDPLKSFLRVVEKRLGWRLHWHVDAEALAAWLRAAEYPPYFFCVKDRHMLPLEVLLAVAEQGGYLYEGLASDALSLFRQLTTTQAWTVACTDSQVTEATAELHRQWAAVGLREEPHAPPEIVQPRARDSDVGGGFGATGADPMDDKDWADIDTEEESSEEEGEAAEPSPTAAKAGEAAPGQAKAGASTAADAATSSTTSGGAGKAGA